MTDQPTPETDAMFRDNVTKDVQILDFCEHNVPEDVQILDFCERLERERDAARAERDELNRQLSVALKGKRPYSAEFADETIASQVKRIAELEEKLNGWFSERNALRAELADERAKKSDALLAAAQDITRMHSALDLIACPMRPDGTYNRDRAACGTLARATLDILSK